MDPRLKLLLRNNSTCADCGDKSPTWCSVNLGVLICAECAGIHRKLGTHISFVQSASLDAWKDSWIEGLEATGNVAGAELYEAALPCCWSRPHLKAIGGDLLDALSAAHMEQFIRAKYEKKLFARSDIQSPRNDHFDSFEVLLRRTSVQEPFGFAPCREALTRGVLRLSTITAESPAGQWNAAQEAVWLQLCVGDCIVSVNGIIVSREDRGAATLAELQQQSQVLLLVKRPPPVRCSYESLIYKTYALFNPAKMDDVHMLLKKNWGEERKLFSRVCAKYVANSDDWCEVLHCLADCAGITPEVSIIAEAEVRQNCGKEQSVLDAFCQRWMGEAPNHPVEQDLAEYSNWPQLQTSLRREDVSTPWGIRHDRSTLQQRHILLVHEVVPDSPAANAGLHPGDVVERLGDEDAAEVALRGKGGNAVPALTLVATFRRMCVA